MTVHARNAGRRRAVLPVLACAIALLLAGCSLGAPAASSSSAAVPASSGATLSAPVPTPTVVAGDSPRVAALAYRTTLAAARGRHLDYLEFLCSVPSARDAATVFVAVHERTSWDSGRTSLDEVLAQPVRPVAAGTYRPGPAVSLKQVRNGRLAGDAIIGLVGPDHRCSASYIGAPVTG